jgi:hypothetical protein
MKPDLIALADRCEEASRPFGDFYAVTEDGEVWSIATGRWVRLKPRLTERGYGVLSLTVSGQRKDVRLNRVICEAWHGPAPFPEAVARHLDDDRSNNVVTNICWGSQSDNVHDAMRNGKSDPAANGRAGAAKISGEKSYLAKMTWESVRDIRARAKAGDSISQIARDLGFDRSNISLIVNNKTWKEREVA